MNCEFSETQFSFCFTFEYIKQFFPVIPLPVFPNTVVEGRAGGGYDVEILGNIFFQFKIPTYHDIKSIRNKKHWDVFGKAYYKIKIDTSSQQFKLLKALDKPENKVFYATPEFHLWTSLTDYYQHEHIVDNSALFPIQNFPVPIGGYHHMIYRPDYNFGQLFSEPTRIIKLKTINPTELFNREQREIKMTIYKQALEIRKVLLTIDSEIIDKTLFNENNQIEFVKSVHNVLLTRYNIHWYPVLSL